MKSLSLAAICLLYYFSIITQKTCFSLESPGNKSIAPGKVWPTWQPLNQYQVPDWFHNA